jgi:hypothetical protein
MQHIFSEPMLNTLRKLYESVAVQYAKLNYDSLRKEKLLMGSNEEWMRLVLEYLGTNFYDKGVYQIVKTNQKLFLDILNDATNEGWGIYETVKHILQSEQIAAITAARAEVIARTELGKAIHAGTYVGADNSPFLKQKTWIAAKDQRTRGNPFNDQTPQDTIKRNPDHYHMDGQVVPFNEMFKDPRSGVELEHPHDPKAAGKDVINCRCTYAVTNVRDKNGRLVRKPEFTVRPIS